MNTNMWLLSVLFLLGTAKSFLLDEGWVYGGNGGGDYEGFKAASKVSSSSASRREEEEMRQMVADLDRFSRRLTQ